MHLHLFPGEWSYMHFEHLRVPPGTRLAALTQLPSSRANCRAHQIPDGIFLLRLHVERKEGVQRRESIAHIQNRYTPQGESRIFNCRQYILKIRNHRTMKEAYDEKIAERYK